jgi:hypothetical protein
MDVVPETIGSRRQKLFPKRLISGALSCHQWQCWPHFWVFIGFGPFRHQYQFHTSICWSKMAGSIPATSLAVSYSKSRTPQFLVSAMPPFWCRLTIKIIFSLLQHYYFLHALSALDSAPSSMSWFVFTILLPRSPHGLYRDFNHRHVQHRYFFPPSL